MVRDRMGIAQRRRRLDPMQASWPDELISVLDSSAVETNRWMQRPMWTVEKSRAFRDSMGGDLMLPRLLDEFDIRKTRNRQKLGSIPFSSSSTSDGNAWSDSYAQRSPGSGSGLENRLSRSPAKFSTVDGLSTKSRHNDANAPSPAAAAVVSTSQNSGSWTASGRCES
jgi:hypothetical protein